MAKLKVVHKWVGLGQVQSFMLILGRIELGHFICGSVLVGSRKLDPRPTLVDPHCSLSSFFCSFLFVWLLSVGGLA